MIKADCIKDPNEETAVSVDTGEKQHQFNYDVKNALEKAGYKPKSRWRDRKNKEE